ncbi:MAG: type I restriction-modification enzyme R subunit C-terminal domain-containing protein [Endozoicomonas sp.]
MLPSELNRFLFNEDTVDKMLEVLMRQGIKVGGGDTLGKTIVFAANNDHAQFIQERFDKQYPKWAGKFARVITYKEDYAETLIDEFKETKVPAGKVPLNIAISVDMLDTGIDVPEVLNLVFFKVVQSKVKFLQMVGRGTRVCPELFGPNLTAEKENDKQFFKVFDYCQNFEFFEQKPEGAPDSSQKPLAQLIFEKRLELTHGLKTGEEESDQQLRSYVLDILHHQVAGMTLENFIVRPRRETVEKYLKRDTWSSLSDDQYSEILTQVASLPTEAEAINEDEADDELAKRFDHLLLQMQLEKLNGQGVSEARHIKVVEAAEQLEAKSSIPMVAAHLGLLQQIQTPEFWEHISLATLDEVRRKLRNLMQFLDKGKKTIVYTDFGDEFEGDIKEVPMPATSVGLEQYHKKVRAFVRDNENQITIQRLKRGKPVTEKDLEQLDSLLFEASGMEDKNRYLEVVHKDQPVGVFIRSLVGLDREAAKAVFAEYLNDSGFNAVQMEFINTIIDWLCQNGTMEPAALYDPPFINFDDDSVFGLFSDEQAGEIVDKLKAVNESAFPVGATGTEG